MNDEKKMNARITGLLGWPAFGYAFLMILSLLLAILDIRGIWHSGPVGVNVIGGFCLIFLIFSIIRYFRGRKAITRDLKMYAEECANVREASCMDMELPYAIASEDGRLLWYNQNFHNISGKTENLLDLFPELQETNFPEVESGEDILVNYETLTYRMEIRPISRKKVSLSEKEEFTEQKAAGQEPPKSAVLSDTEIASATSTEAASTASSEISTETAPTASPATSTETASTSSPETNTETTSKASPETDTETSSEAVSGIDIPAEEAFEINTGSDTEPDTEPETESDDDLVYGIFLYDETEKIFCEEELEREKMAAGLIYLDNYEEALASVEDVRRSLLVALIDRKINRYFQDMDAIVRKTEKDKYFIAVKQRHIQALKDSHFSVLEDVKSVNIGNDMAITLSIGIGMNGLTYAKNFEYARTAIDMALARGGDQAVVKDGDRIQYFGGKSQQVEKNTRVKARVKAHALRELVENKDKIIVMGHKLGDIDCFGSAIGIYRAMTALGKKTQIVINDVTTSVRPLMDEFLANPDYPEDLFINGEKAAGLITDDTVLVVVDVNRISLVEEETLLKIARTIVVLDHHRLTSENIDTAVLSYVEPYASSACEMVAEILQYISEAARLKTLEANALYAGIVLDTNNFTTQTGVRTFEAAAFLKRNGADVVKVRKLFRDNMNDYKAKAAAVHNAEVFCDSYAISICPAEESESPTIIGAQAANELLNIIGIKASIVLTEYNGKIYVSARSIDEVNVQMMMERLGGGGHLSTAGAQLTGCTIEEAKELVKETVKQMIDEGFL